MAVLDRKIKAVDERIDRGGRRAPAPRLTDIVGVGPVTAATILGEVGDVARFATADHFASYTGTAPIEASSGESIRHRLSRAGNRRLNYALHVVALSNKRYDPRGKAYYERKLAAGKGTEGIAALPQTAPLRRRLPRPRRRPGSSEPGRADGGDTHSQRG